MPPLETWWRLQMTKTRLAAKAYAAGARREPCTSSDCAAMQELPCRARGWGRSAKAPHAFDRPARGEANIARLLDLPINSVTRLRVARRAG
jgi:hypothetical protein